MRLAIAPLLLCLLVLPSGCNTAMEAENAQTIRLEFKEGSGTVSGVLKAGSPGMAGISSRNFEIQVPGSFEVSGGPSEYEILFTSIPQELKKSWTLSVEGVERQRGQGMIVEDDKGPRVSFMVSLKKSN
jgi:hypothetical protein